MDIKIIHFLLSSLLVTMATGDDAQPASPSFPSPQPSQSDQNSASPSFPSPQPSQSDQNSASPSFPSPQPSQSDQNSASPSFPSPHSTLTGARRFINGPTSTSVDLRTRMLARLTTAGLEGIGGRVEPGGSVGSPGRWVIKGHSYSLDDAVLPTSRNGNLGVVWGGGGTREGPDSRIVPNIVPESAMLINEGGDVFQNPDNSKIIIEDANQNSGDAKILTDTSSIPVLNGEVYSDSNLQHNSNTTEEQANSSSSSSSSNTGHQGDATQIKTVPDRTMETHNNNNNNNNSTGTNSTQLSTLQNTQTSNTMETQNNNNTNLTTQKLNVTHNTKSDTNNNNNSSNSNTNTTPSDMQLNNNNNNTSINTNSSSAERDSNATNNNNNNNNNNHSIKHDTIISPSQKNLSPSDQNIGINFDSNDRDLSSVFRPNERPDSDGNEYGFSGSPDGIRQNESDIVTTETDFKITSVGGSGRALNGSDYFDLDSTSASVTHFTTDVNDTSDTNTHSQPDSDNTEIITQTTTTTTTTTAMKDSKIADHTFHPSLVEKTVRDFTTTATTANDALTTTNQSTLHPSLVQNNIPTTTTTTAANIPTTTTTANALTTTNQSTLHPTLVENTTTTTNTTNTTTTSTQSTAHISSGSWRAVQVFIFLSAFCLAVIGFLYWRRRRHNNNNMLDDEIPVFTRHAADYHNPTFSMDDATNFMAKIGRGSNYKTLD